MKGFLKAFAAIFAINGLALFVLVLAGGWALTLIFILIVAFLAFVNRRHI